MVGERRVRGAHSTHQLAERLGRQKKGECYKLIVTHANDFRDQIYVHLVDEMDFLWGAVNHGTQSEGQVRDGRWAT